MAQGHARPLVIAAATTRELAAALTPLIGEQAFPEQGRILSCIVGDCSVLALATGIGPVNAGIALGRLLGEQKSQIAGVLNVGIAGTFAPKVLSVGQVGVASEEIWPEFGLAGDHGVDPTAVGIPQAKFGDGPIWDRISLNPRDSAAALGLVLDPSWPLVSFLTVAGATGTLDRAKYLGSKYNTILENMEGFALALACRFAELPFVELRTVSNVVGQRDGWRIKDALKNLGQATARAFGLVDGGKAGDQGK